jgi:hypothetical protein
MANFHTHLVVAAIAGTAASSWLWGHRVIGPADAVGLTLVATLGGLLPDLDADNSVPTRWLWTSAGICSGLTFAASGPNDLSPLGLGLGAFCTYLIVRHFVCAIVMRWTRHRGVFHSVPSAAFCALAMLWLVAEPLAQSKALALLMALFLCGGFLVHLALDEIYSVDLTNARIKRSFGSALKLFDAESPWCTLMLYAALLFAFWYCTAHQLWPRDWTRELVRAHHRGVLTLWKL